MRRKLQCMPLVKRALTWARAIQHLTPEKAQETYSVRYLLGGYLCGFGCHLCGFSGSSCATRLCGRCESRRAPIPNLQRLPQRARRRYRSGYQWYLWTEGSHARRIQLLGGDEVERHRLGRGDFARILQKGALRREG